MKKPVKEMLEQLDRYLGEVFPEEMLSAALTEAHRLKEARIYEEVYNAATPAIRVLMRRLTRTIPVPKAKKIMAEQPMIVHLRFFELVSMLRGALAENENRSFVFPKRFGTFLRQGVKYYSAGERIPPWLVC